MWQRDCRIRISPIYHDFKKDVDLDITTIECWMTGHSQDNHFSITNAENALSICSRKRDSNSVKNASSVCTPPPYCCGSSGRKYSWVDASVVITRERKRRRLKKPPMKKPHICLGAQPDLQACAWLMGAAGGRSVVSAGGKGELGDR